MPKRSIHSILEWAETLKTGKLEELISELEEILDEKRGDEFRDNY